MASSILLTNTPSLLPDGVELVSVTWEVAEDPYFQNIVRASYNDTEHLRFIIFDTVGLDPTKEYYARVIENHLTVATGAITSTAPSNVEVIKIEDTSSVISELTKPPSLITSTDIIIPNFDPNKIPVSNFVIGISGVPSYVDGIGLGKAWLFIEDLLGRVIYKKQTQFQPVEDDSVGYKYAYLLADVVLPSNMPLIVTAILQGDNGDVSSPMSKIIYTYNAPEIELTSPIDMADPNQDLTVTLAEIPDMQSIAYTLYASGLEYLKELYSNTTDALSFTIPASAFVNPLKTYILKVEVTFLDGSTDFKYIPFRTL